MGTCAEQSRRLLDMFNLVWFALLILPHSHVVSAAGHRSTRLADDHSNSGGSSRSRGSSSGTTQRRMDVQMQTSDENDVSSFPRHIKTAQVNDGRTLSHDPYDQTRQKSNMAKIPRGMGTEISSLADADSGEKRMDAADAVDSLNEESKNVVVVKRFQKRMNSNSELSTSSTGSESMQNVPVDTSKSHQRNHEHPKRMDLDLTASVSSRSQAAMQMSSDQLMHPLHQSLCTYSITIETGKKFGAGTDSTISLSLYNKDEDRVYFSSLDNGNNNFERGRIDTFLELGPCVEGICKMILTTDDSGLFSDWFVEKLSFSVTTPVTGHQEKTWVLHQWLPSTDDSASIFILKDDCSYAYAPTPPHAP